MIGATIRGGRIIASLMIRAGRLRLARAFLAAAQVMLLPNNLRGRRE